MATKDIREAARAIIYACGIGGYGPELSDDNPLVVRSVAAVQKAADIYAANQCKELRTEVDRLRSELVKVYDAIGSRKVSCPRCGGKWFVPEQLWGDPRFDCPHCADE